MAIRLADLQSVFGNEPEVEIGDYKFVYGDGEVRGTPVKSKSNNSSILLTPSSRYHKKKKKQRRDSLSDSSSNDESNTSDTSNSDSDNEKSKTSIRNQSYISETNGARMDEGTYFEQLKEMKADFDRMIRFLREALKGVARVGVGSGVGGSASAGDVGREWDVFAEMIEGGYGLV